MKSKKQIQLDVLARGVERLYRSNRNAEAFEYAQAWHIINSSR